MAHFIGVLLLLLTIGLVQDCFGEPCTPKQLGVFVGVTPNVNECQHMTNVSFTMPPTSEMPPDQMIELCKTKACRQMIGVIDDLDIPKCEVQYANQNMTLQASLDKFTALCDTISIAPGPRKRLKVSSSSRSDSASGSSSSSPFGKKKRTPKSAAEPIASLNSVLFAFIVVIFAVTAL